MLSHGFQCGFCVPNNLAFFLPKREMKLDSLLALFLRSDTFHGIKCIFPFVSRNPHKTTNNRIVTFLEGVTGMMRAFNVFTLAKYLPRILLVFKHIHCLDCTEDS